MRNGTCITNKNNKMEKETYTIVHKSGKHYDTNDEGFYDSNWERTQDKKAYLEMLIQNNPEKFEGCQIEDNE